MNKIKKLIILFTLIITIVFTSLPIYAASFSLTASKTSVSPNGKFTISVGGSCTGRVNLTVKNGTLSTSSVWVENGKETVTVTAGSSGTVTVTATPAKGFSDADGNEYNPGSRSVTVKITSGGSSGGGGNTSTTTKSKDNALKSLKVSEGTLSPSFKASTTSYTVDLASTVTSIKIDAVANHSKATVKGTGTHELEPGENEIKITVTAENGNPKVYTIKAIVDESPIVFVPFEGNELGVVRNLKKLKPLEGFEETTVKVNDVDTLAFHSKSRNITLLYLQNNDQKDYYVYDGNQVLSIYKPLEVNELAYAGVPTELQERKEMTFGDVEINGMTIKGWKFNNEQLSNYSLIYVMNEVGEYSYYQYESSEKTLQLYPSISFVSQEEFDQVVEENTLIKEEKETMTMYFYIACGVAVVTSIFAIVGFVNANRFKNRLLNRNRKEMNEE